MIEHEQSDGLRRVPVTNAPSWYSADGVAAAAAPDGRELEEFRSRQALLRAVLVSGGLDAVVTVKQANVRYLTGYSTVMPGKAALAVTRDGAFLAVAESELGRASVTPALDGIYVFGWDERVDIGEWLATYDGTKDCRVVVHDGEGSVLGTSSSDPDELPPVKDRMEIIDRVRMVTSDWGAARMRRAGLATKAGIEAALGRAVEGDATDADMAAAAMSAMVRASGYEFPAIFVVGVDEGAGIAHSPWGRRRLEPGSVAFLEFSGGFDGYCAPVMRTLVREPVADDVQFLFARVEAILDTLYQELWPGARCSDVAAKCTQQLAGVDDVLFHYNFGYPVSVFDDQTSWMNGPDFHIVQDNDGALEAGMTFHLPISLRRFGRYAVGQSQTVRIVDGGVEILTDGVPAGLLRVPA